MEKKITVYYDGMCRGCSVAADALSAEPGKMYFVDANKTELPAGITFQDAMHDVYAVDVSGRRYKGAEAVLKILEQYPKWRWLSKLGQLPGMRNIAAMFYRTIAHNRYWLFGRKNVS